MMKLNNLAAAMFALNAISFSGLALAQATLAGSESQAQMGDDVARADYTCAEYGYPASYDGKVVYERVNGVGKVFMNTCAISNAMPSPSPAPAPAPYVETGSDSCVNQGYPGDGTVTAKRLVDNGVAGAWYDIVASCVVAQAPASTTAPAPLPTQAPTPATAPTQPQVITKSYSCQDGGYSAAYYGIIVTQNAVENGVIGPSALVFNNCQTLVPASIMQATVYPASGTYLRAYCFGTTQSYVYADGKGGEYNSGPNSQFNSVFCGYIAPPLPSTQPDLPCTQGYYYGREQSEYMPGTCSGQEQAHGQDHGGGYSRGDGNDSGLSGD